MFVIILMSLILVHIIDFFLFCPLSRTHAFKYLQTIALCCVLYAHMNVPF